MRRLRGAVSSASGAVMRHHVVLTAVAAARVPHAVLPVAALPLLHHLAALGCPRQRRPRPGQCAGRDGEGLEVQLWHVRVYVQNEGAGAEEAVQSVQHNTITQTSIGPWPGQHSDSYI